LRALSIRLSLIKCKMPLSNMSRIAKAVFLDSSYLSQLKKRWKWRSQNEAEFTIGRGDARDTSFPHERLCTRGDFALETLIKECGRICATSRGAKLFPSCFSKFPSSSLASLGPWSCTRFLASVRSNTREITHRWRSRSRHSARRLATRLGVPVISCKCSASERDGGVGWGVFLPEDFTK
jgi:hypothetical protein